jgi:hypothetical protein
MLAAFRRGLNEAGYETIVVPVAADRRHRPMSRHAPTAGSWRSAPEGVRPHAGGAGRGGSGGQFPRGRFLVVASAATAAMLIWLCSLRDAQGLGGKNGQRC